MKKIQRRCLAALLAVILLAAAGFLVYAGNPYRASDTARAALESSGHVTVTEVKNKEIIFQPEEIQAGLIFYPGGKVEYQSYAPLLHQLAEQGVLCVVEHMPFNLAVFNSKAAEGVQERWPELTSWYIGGHSLGGAMAANYLASCEEKYEGLVLLASYSASDLSDRDVRVLSLYGSEDQVLNREKYEENRKNLPEDVTEIEISGGCHGWFGSYGKQKGDGEASITPEQQWEISVQEITDWMEIR